MPIVPFAALVLTASFTTCAIAADAITYTQPLESRIIEWRRDLHANPELSNREFRTLFFVDESGLAPAAAALTQIALDYLRPGTR